MLLRAKEILVFALGFGLPLHGVLSVLAPPEVRWWKEVLLLLLLGLAILSLLKDRQNFVVPKIVFKSFITSWPLYAVLFLVWGMILVGLNADINTSLVAYRYLGLGFFATLLGYALWRTTLKSVKYGYKKSLCFFHNFCTGLVLGVFMSTGFGVWAKFFGGYATLEDWYSTTISSWVPGQTIPLYHQVGDFIRLQGASSGPVEYAHLVVLALWYILFFKISCRLKSTGLWVILSFFLFFGILQSGSRAALLGALILVGLKFYSLIKPRLARFNFAWTIDKGAVLLLVVIVLLGMIKFTLSQSLFSGSDFLNQNVVRISDIDHLARPMAAFYKVLKNPVLGNLGELGPAARAKNLVFYNNDQALIAESVPFDILAQMGLLGFVFWLGFFIFYYRQASYELRALVLTFIPLMLLATIFDMTPVSISFYLILGLGVIIPRITKATPADHRIVFNLKKLAFKRYVEAVWGWQEAEQINFVAKELAQGGIYLVSLRGQIVGTYCIVETPTLAQLYSFYIHPAYQSLGLGAYLINNISKARVLRLQVLKVNSLAQAFYDFHGFEKTGEDEYHWHLQRLT